MITACILPLIVFTRRHPYSLTTLEANLETFLRSNALRGECWVAIKLFVWNLHCVLRVCVQVSLPEGVLVRVEGVAVCGGERSSMHVQSVSHWAPANIGPYSQAYSVS